ncbi:MAG: hypothetical protein OXC63_10900 [Aestuariivita sp.]|nr:hypothetical protein [Aestuariivita sp.]MCY4347690.1 hypothetical protein [Aestuariivita sp.]
MISYDKIKFGHSQVPLLTREWHCAPEQLYRKTYSLKPGQSWFDAPVTSDQKEHYVLDDIASIQKLLN